MQHVCSMEMLFLLSLLLWNEKNWVLASQECGSVVNNTLTSPGYPNNYPRNMHCEYWVPVPDGMTLIISFQDFVLESHRRCRYDYLKITNEKKQSFGVYCGEKTGQTVNVTGDYAVITFHSDYSVQRRGFRILFNTTVSPKVVIPAPVVQVLTGTKLSCSATGTPPIYIAITRNSTTLLNTTNSASIPVTEGGNYTCRATSKYGTDEKEVVFINACPRPCDCAPYRYDRSLIEVNCSGKQLTSVPGPLPANTRLLDLSNNTLKHLPAGVFSNNTKLTEL